MLRAHDHEQQVEKQRATSVLSAIEKVRSALADLEKADDYPNDPDINKRIEHHNTHDQLVYRPRPRTIKQREVADEWALNHDPAFRHAQTDHAALKARFVWRGLTGDDQQRYTTAIANLRKSLDTLEARNMRGLRNAKRTTDAPRLNHRAKQSLLQTLTELCFAWTAASSVIHMRPHLSLNTSRATSKAKRAVRALVNKALGVAKPECIVEAPIPTNSDDYKTITNALRALFASQDPAATS